MNKVLKSSEHKQYWSLIGGLVLFPICIRLDISFSVAVLASPVRPHYETFVFDAKDPSLCCDDGELWSQIPSFGANQRRKNSCPLGRVLERLQGNPKIQFWMDHRHPWNVCGLKNEEANNYGTLQKNAEYIAVFDSVKQLSWTS